MGRTEKYREIRRTKSRYLASMTIFALVLTGGIGAADYSLGSLMKNSNELSVLHIKYPSEGQMEISLMDRNFSVNLIYLRRDLERIKYWLGKKQG